MKRILLSLLFCPLTVLAMGNRSYTMRSQPDNERTVDLKLTWHIFSEDVDNLPDSDSRVIASYYAIFRGCKNGISNLAPATAAYSKNPQGYTLTPIILSMACEKHLMSSTSLQYTTQIGSQRIEQKIRLEFSGKSPLVCKDPTNPSFHMRILLAELKNDKQQ